MRNVFSGLMGMLVGLAAIECGGTSDPEGTLRPMTRKEDPIGATAPRPTAAGRGLKLSRKDAIADIRELVELLESAHPDPYVRGGGKIAFHRRLQRLIQGLPPEEIDTKQLATMLKPFVAAVGDGHTAIADSRGTRDRANPGGIPLYFDVVEDLLFVRSVTDAAHLPLIGHQLESVNGVGFDELVDRQARLGGHENRSQLLASLGTHGTLFYGETLAQLIPEWQRGDKIAVGLRNTRGKTNTFGFEPSAGVRYPLIERSAGGLVQEAQNKWFHYQFLGRGRRTAYLAITSMSTFREAFEYWHAKGDTGMQSWAGRVYELINHTPAPSDYAEVIRGIPAASDTFSALFQEMNRAGTEVLIVDLTRNGGGLDLMNQMLLYYLVGFDRTVTLSLKNREVRKCSAFLAGTSEAGLGLEQIPYFDQVPLTPVDYDFSKDPDFDKDKVESAVRGYLARSFGMMPTFSGEFDSRKHESLYMPPKIVVLSSATTFSAAFNLLTDLHRLGAVTVGVSSGQAGNSFGDVRRFELTRSKLGGTISTKYFEAFAADPVKGKMLPVDIPITYRDLSDLGFDEHAILQFALERL